MGKNQQAPDFGRGTAFLEEDERLYVAQVMEQNGAKHSGCLLLQAPLWLLLALAIAACWLAYVAIARTQPPTVAPILILGGLLLPTITVARRWIFRIYYRQPVVIGGREWRYCDYYGRPVVIGSAM